MWGITNNIHTVTEKYVLMCNYLLCHKLHTKELSISNISESLISVSSVSIFSSSSFSLSYELHNFRFYEQDTGNSSLLSISDDNLTMDIFVIIV